MQPATIRYAEASEPANLCQCWSSYPYTDDQLMPTLQAIDAHGNVIVTLASVSQHAETLGFNPDPEQRTWLNGDRPHFFRDALEQAYGEVGIEMARSVGSGETPQVFDQPISRVPQQYQDVSHPAGYRTLFDANGRATPVGYYQETAALGDRLAGAVEAALDSSASTSRSSQIWGPLPTRASRSRARLSGRRDRGLFAERPGYTANCTIESPAAADGSTTGDEIKTTVAAFQIGDGSFISVPGEAFPFTYLRASKARKTCPSRNTPCPVAYAAHAHAIPVHRRTGRGHGRLHLPARQRGRPCPARIRAIPPPAK